MADLPLLNKRIVVTRDEQRARGLGGRLRALGAEPLLIPSIRIIPAGPSTSTREAVSHLSDFDWAVFTSAIGVESFFSLLTGMAIAELLEGSRAASPRFAAVGPVTARSLRRRGVERFVVPSTYSGAHLVEALGEINGKSILLPRGQLASHAIPRTLEQKGAVVTALTVYETVEAEPDDAARSTLSTGFDAVLFTSGSTVTYFCRAVDRRARGHLDEALIACIGPSTSRVARQLGLTVDVEPASYTVAALIEAVARHYNLLSTI